MCVPRVHRRVFTCAHFCVSTRHVFVFQENTCCYQMNTCVSVFLRAHKCLCSRVQCTCVCSLVHMCVFTCSHVCLPRVHIYLCSRLHTCVLIRHVYVFQLSTCLFSDEHSRVFHVYTYVCSRVPHVCSNWTRVCVPGEHTVVVFPGAHLCECSRVHICVFTCIHRCAHVCSTKTHVYVSGGQMCVPREHITMC